MADGTTTQQEDIGFDRPLFVIVILLIGFGVVMVYSASGVRATQEQHNAAFFLMRQSIYAGLGVAAMLVGSRIDYHWYSRIIYPLLALSIFGLLLCHSPIGRTINGAARWIGVGSFTIQPAEIVKLSLVLWLSYSLAKKHDKIKSFSIGFLPHILVPGAAIIFCLIQPDFGSSVVIALVVFSLLFISGAKLGYLLLSVVVAAPLGYWLVAGSEYRWKRVMAFLDPLSQRYGEGYQLSQSLFGFGTGGVSGVGLGDGLQKYFFLPEAHNDFIASIIGEELGMIGIWMVIMAFALVVARGVVIALRAADELGTYTAFGITVLIGLQALANLAVAMGLLPTKGLNLPFVSYGGSALVISLYSVGVLLNVSRSRGHGVARESHAPQSNSTIGNVRRRATVAEQGGGA